MPRALPSAASTRFDVCGPPRFVAIRPSRAPQPWASALKGPSQEVAQCGALGRAADRPKPRRRTASDRPNPRRRTASDRPNPRRRTASDRPKPLRLSHSLRLCVENRPAHSGSQELPEHPTSHPAVNRQTQQLRSRPLRHRQRAGPHPIPGKLTGQRRVVDLRLHASRC